MLLVDDDVVQLKLVKAQFEDAGFVVAAARGALAAEEMLRTHALPDAIVSDIVMDDVDGFTLCRRLRDDARLDRTPIVLLSSAFDEDEDQRLALRVGANALVARSVDQDACVDALVKSLDAPPTAPTRASRAPELYANRMAHQLARVSGRHLVAERRCDVLFEHATDAISVVTTEGIVIDANRTWQRILGASREELRGRRVRDFVAPGHEVEVEAEFRAVATVPSARSRPFPIRRWDGQILQLEFTTARIDIDGTPTMLCVGRDMTELVEANRKLEASENHYRSLVENVPDVLWSSTADWRYTFLSPNVERLTGLTAEYICAGEHGVELGQVHPDDVERVQAARRATSEQGTPLDIEYRWRRHDGRFRWLHLRAARTSLGIDGILSDITSRRELEDRLHQSQKIEAIGQLAAGIAHDFNNVLAAITMNASLLADAPVDAPNGEISRDILHAASRGAELTKQLLSFSRPKLCAPSEVDVNRVLAGLERMLSRLVGPEIALAVHLEPDLARVFVDENQLEQVVMNFVVNARDAMNGAGTLDIRTASVDVASEDAARELGGRPGAYVRLSVTDDGCGMDDDTRRRVFEPFFTTKVERGTGLGLATCHGIVRNAGGFIAVESEIGQGTTFHAYLPRSPGARKVGHPGPDH